MSEQRLTAGDRELDGNADDAVRVEQASGYRIRESTFTDQVIRSGALPRLAALPSPRPG